MRALDNVRNPSGRNSTCAWRCCRELSTETDLLPSLDAKRPLAQAYREPLRKQLRRRPAAPERDHRAVGIPRFREDTWLRDQRPETRGADRPQFHAAARALLREHGWGWQEIGRAHV